jgi:hypothetical protein
MDQEAVSGGGRRGAGCVGKGGAGPDGKGWEGPAARKLRRLNERMKGADEQGGMRERGAFVVGAGPAGRSWEVPAARKLRRLGGNRELGRKKAGRNGLLKEVVRDPRSEGQKNPTPRSAGKKSRVENQLDKKPVVNGGLRQIY